MEAALVPLNICYSRQSPCREGFGGEAACSLGERRAHSMTAAAEPFRVDLLKRLLQLLFLGAHAGRRGTDPSMANKPPSKYPLRLPRGGSAIVSQAKICDYLLSPTHPIGRFKAAFFSALGYTIENWQRLQEDLLELARSGEAFAGQENPYGQKYEVRGTLVGPSGRRADLVTVWIVLTDATYPQLVTAYPGE